MGRLSTITPAELPPIASSRGSFDLRQLQRRDDPLVVVGRIGLLDRLPHDLVAEDRLAIDHGRDLQIGRAQVEADAAAVQVASQRLTALARRGRFISAATHDGERMAVDLLAHEVVIELARAVRRIDLGDVLTDAARPADGDLPAAARPQQEFDDPLGIGQIGFEAGMAVRESDRLVARHGAVGTLQADDQRHALAGSRDLLPERPVGERCGSEFRLQGGSNLGAMRGNGDRSLLTGDFIFFSVWHRPRRHCACRR